MGKLQAVLALPAWSLTSLRRHQMVTQVSSEGALKGGVAAGDILLDVDGMDVRNRRMISKYLRGAPW